ncbi:MAG: neutral/alkaline non-lysosomal ceramidase N-terminal domain-containing protein [Acidobacteriota bacterium]
MSRKGCGHRFLALFLCGLLGPGEAVAAAVWAGVAVVDITPPAGGTLAGYQSGRTSERVHDRLFARVLLLQAEEMSLVVVNSDLHRMRLPSLVDRIRRELGMAHIILSATHSHSAPVLDGESGENPWTGKTENQIFEAVRQARQRLFPAILRVGQGSLLGAHNVRIAENGFVRERWSNPTEEVTAPISPTVTVLRVDEESERPRALLVHYACEPAILGPANREISADFPGALARYVHETLGPGTACLFVPGASANIYPFQARLRGPEGFAEVEKMGLRLGREAVRVARALKPTETSGLKVAEETLTFRNRWRPEIKLEVGLSAALVNNILALIAVPGELFFEFQLALSAKAPKAPSLISLVLGSSYSGGRSWAGTIPTIAAAAEGGWGASYATDIEVGAGEVILDQGVIQLFRFFGKLDDLPRGILIHDIPDLPSP